MHLTLLGCASLCIFSHRFHGMLDKHARLRAISSNPQAGALLDSAHSLSPHCSAHVRLSPQLPNSSPSSPRRSLLLSLVGTQTPGPHARTPEASVMGASLGTRLSNVPTHSDVVFSVGNQEPFLDAWKHKTGGVCIYTRSDTVVLLVHGSGLLHTVHHCLSASACFLSVL